MGDSHDNESGDQSEQTPTTSTPSKKSGRVVRMARFISTHRWYYSGVLLAMILAGFFGYGMAQRWGAGQWGPFSGWVAGTLTLTAVVVALRESFRGERARRVDHELTRRRECIDALSELWSGVSRMALVVPDFTAYLRGLPEEFDLDKPLESHIFGRNSEHPARIAIQEAWLDYMNRWNTEISPSIFKVFSLMSGTPLDEPLMRLKDNLNSITAEVGEAFMYASQRGRRPNLKGTIERWGQLEEGQAYFIALARQHLTLDRTLIERDIL